MAEKQVQENPETAGNVIAEEIREDIVKGVYKTGDKIRESELCKKYGVSRTPVREAFRLLQNEGLLVHIPQCGVKVAKFEEAETLHLHQVRAALECLSSREAANYISEEEIRILRRINDDLREFDEQNAVHSMDLDKDFHLTIAKASRNTYVMEYLENVLLKNQLVKYFIPFKRERIPYTYKEHEDIILALERHDPYLAEEYTKIHFYNSILSIESKIKQYEAEHLERAKKKKIRDK